MEIIFGIYGREADEVAIRTLQFTIYPWNYIMIIFIVTTYFLPIFLWSRKVWRRNLLIVSIACISVNIGMWLERYILFIPGQINKQVFTFTWANYTPSLFEGIIVLGTFALVTLLLLLFSKVMPLIPLYDIKEGDILKTEVQIGRRTVPATFRED